MTKITRLEARYVDNAKLDALLQQLFGSSYRVMAANDVIEVTASRQLTEEEIKSVIKAF